MAGRSVALKTILAFAFGTMAAALALSLSALISYHGANTERLAVSARLGSISEVMINLLDEGLFERINEVKMLSESTEALANPIQGRYLLESLKKSTPEYAWIGVVSKEGKAIYASRPEGEGLLLPAEIVNTKNVRVGGVQEDSWISEVLGERDKNNKEKYIRISAPFSYKGDESSQQVVAYLSWEWARQRVKNMLTPARRAVGIEIFILDKNEKLLFSSSKEESIRMPMLSSLKSTKVLYWPDGKAYLTGLRVSKGWQNYEGLGWQVVVRQPAEKAFLGIATLQRYAMTGGAIFALIFVLIGMGVAWLLSRPLTQLAEDADFLRVNPDKTALHDGGAIREIRSLSQSFSLLLGERRSYEHQLKDLNEGLEEQVKQRTVALEESNHSLKKILSEREVLMQQLEKLASTDSLTGLLNRRAFYEKAELERQRALRQKTATTVLTFDIDFFKRVNDSYGHEIGDDVLKKCAAVCLGQLREIDILARFGGEEFVILLPNTDHEQGAMVAERLRMAFEAVVVPTVKGDLRFTASFGGAVFDAEADLAKALKAADHALYAAKHGGRNRVEMAAIDL